MTHNEGDRYWSVTSHHPDQRFMVWDFEDNTAVAYCYEEEHADRVAKALNRGGVPVSTDGLSG
jgi:hypothetical protein